jgi:AraC-like DNA-binding protein
VSITTAAFFLRPLGRALRAQGVSPAEVLAPHGIDEQGTERRVPFATANAIWERAVARTAPWIGLEAARARQAGDFGALEYAARSSESLRRAFDRLSRYHRLLNDRTEVELSSAGGVTRVRYLRPGPLAAMVPSYLEFVLASWVWTARDLAEAGVTPATVLLCHPAPAEVALHREVFGADVRFGAEEAEIHIADAILDAALPRSDASLGRVLDRHLEALMGELAASAAWTRRTSSAVERRLGDGPPRLEAVAHDLAIAPRALRARLEQEGTSFAAVVDDTRRRLAASMVEDASLSLDEIAFLLGFSETSAFHRAYRRWTGRTPRAAGRSRSEHR